MTSKDYYSSYTNEYVPLPINPSKTKTISLSDPMHLFLIDIKKKIHEYFTTELLIIK